MKLRATLFSFALIAASLALSSCQTDVAYFGESYAPTTNVDCYFATGDIKRPYKIMGKAIATPGAFSADSEFQNDIMNVARMRGADAIVVESFDKVRTGQTTNWSNNGDAWKSRKDVWWNESGSATTQDTHELRAAVYFVKYTQ